MQKTLSQALAEIRRIQSRIGSFPKNRYPFSSLSLQSDYSQLLDKLSPRLELCRFHPFTENLQFDFSGFSEKRTENVAPAIFKGLPPSTRQVSKDHGTQKAKNTEDIDSKGEKEHFGNNNSDITLYQHISHLVNAVEEHLAKRDRSHLEQKNETSLQRGSLSAKRTERKELTESESRCENLNIETHVLNKISKSVSELEQISNRPTDKQLRLQRAEIKNAFPQKKVSRNQLKQLTDSLWQGGKEAAASDNNSSLTEFRSQSEKKRSKTLPGEIGRDRVGSLNEETEKMRHIPITAGKEGTSQINQHLNPHEIIQHPQLTERVEFNSDTTRPAASFSSENQPHLTQSNETTKNEPTMQNLKNVSFRDVGRLETLKVADALSEYLEEQANLHGDFPL